MFRVPLTSLERKKKKKNGFQGQHPLHDSLSPPLLQSNLCRPAGAWPHPYNSGEQDCKWAYVNFHE